MLDLAAGAPKDLAKWQGIKRWVCALSLLRVFHERCRLHAPLEPPGTLLAQEGGGGSCYSLGSPSRVHSAPCRLRSHPHTDRNLCLKIVFCGRTEDGMSNCGSRSKVVSLQFCRLGNRLNG